MEAIKILHQDDEYITVGGYGVVFGGKDLEGDTFTKSTNFFPELAPQKLTFYDHAQGEIKSSFGFSEVKSIDSKGLWVESQLERHNRYIEQVLKLIEAGALGYSSGSVPHLVERDGGLIKSWPIVEFSLTPVPAEPRTIGVDIIKSISEQNPEFKAFLPEGEQETPAEPTTADSSETQPKGDIKMAEEKQVEETAVEEKEVETKTAVVEKYDDAELKAEIKALNEELEKMKSIKINAVPTQVTKAFTDGQKSDSDFLKWVRDGGKSQYEVKAVNITTPTEGQETVPIGHYRQVVARIEELGPLYQTLGVRNIPGRGTTVNVPIDNAAGGTMEPAAVESAAAAEADPTFAQVAMTLASYRTQVRVTYEILNDEDSQLLAFLSNYAARRMVNTHNKLLLDEAAASGTSYHTFAANNAIAAGEVEQIAGNDDLAPYIDDMSGKWVMRNSTKLAIKAITGDRFYSDNTGARQPGVPNDELLDFPVYRSNYAAAIGTTAKSVFLGNWDYMGVRHAPTFTVLRDPYSRAANGEVVFHYFMRTVYKVLQAAAIGYGEHPV